MMAPRHGIQCHLASLCLVAFGLVLLGGWPAAAQLDEVDPASEPRAIHVVREYLPEDLVPSRVKGDMPTRREKFEPMRRDKFESKLKAMQRTVAVDVAGDAKLVSGVFYAKYLDGQLVDGRAGLEVFNKRPANSVLSLAPCRLPIRQLRWSDPDDANVTFGAGAAGNYVVFIDRSSRLLFTWSLRGNDARSPAGSPAPLANPDASFSISLPPSSINQLLIDLPREFVPVVDAGDVRLVNEEFPDPQVVPGEIETGMERWLVALGGTHEFTLRVTPRAAATESLDLTRLRQTTTYRLSKSAIEVQAEISLAFGAGELARLVLQTAPDLRVARVRLGERELLADQITRGTQAGQVVLTFDAPLKGASRKLIVDALAPLVMNQPLRLPSLRPLDLAWEQGSVMLEVPDTLVLKELVFQGAIETSVAARSGMAGGELHHFQLVNQDASGEVVIGRPSTQTVVTSGTAISVSPTTLTAQITADVHVVEGEVYLLDASIVGPWKVESVESEPADALDGTPARRIRGRRIRMQLRQPVSGSQKVRVLIKARCAMPAVRTELTTEDFRIVEFLNIATQRRLVSLRAEAPYHLMVAGTPQPNLEPSELSPEDRALLGPLTSDWEYIDDGGNDAFRVSLTQEKPRYSGRISVEAMADSEVLRQAVRIRCQPESSPISNLRVRLSPAPNVPFTWSTDEPDGVLSARLIKSTDTRAAATWEIHLRQPRATAFYLTAVCSSPLIDATPIYLASLVERVDQTGIVTIGAADGTTLSIDASGLTAVPIVTPGEGEYTFQRAAYRYDPTRDHTVMVSRQSGARQSALAWAWACELASRFEINGVTSHQVLYRLQNNGRPQTEITLPVRATVHRVIVDETEVSYAKSSGGTQRITVQLPAEKRFPSVRVDYSTQGEPLRDFTSQEVGWPEIDVFCLNRIWDIWLPPGIHARQDARFVNTAVTSAPNWEERLFGPAMRRREKRPFDLFSPADWRTIGQDASRDASLTAANFVAAFTNVLEAGDTPDEANENRTWGQVVSRYERLRNSAASSVGFRGLWIDADALGDQGVTADTVLSATGLPSVSRILARDNLAVVAGPDSILLTSVARLGDFEHPVRATVDRNVFTAQHAGSSFAAGSGGVVSPTMWSAEIAVKQTPWARATRQDAGDFDAGWRHYQLHPAATPVVQFSVYRPALFRVMGWGVSFVMIATVVWFSTRRAKTMVLLVLATIITLLVPVEFVPLARGMMWGGLAGLLLTFLRDKSSDGLPHAALPRRGLVTMAGTAVILLIALGAWQVYADDDAKLVSPGAVQIYRVVIPVDEEQQPVGDYVFVPRRLFNELHRPAASAQIAGLSWLLRSAAYEASLALRGDADGLVEAEVSAFYELETFQSSMLVPFPLGRDGVRFLKNVKLDGQVIEPEWNAAGEALEFAVARAGRHRLELEIRPVLRNDAESSGFALHVPEFAGARLKVSPSTRIEGIELPSAVGAIDPNASLGTIAADLGPTNVLAVRWPLSFKTEVESIPLTAVERFWLRIQPSSVVLEGQFSFQVPRGGIEQVRLLVDPRLKLSQLIPSQPASYEPESGPIPSIVVRFDEPDANQVFVHATFLMTDTSGLGNVFLPQLSAVADAKGNSTLGLSVAPQLEVELVADPPLTAILPAEFLQDWKEPTDAPQLAYRLASRTSAWHVNSRPRVVPPTAEQLSSWSIGSTRAALHYSADIDPGGQACFQQRLRIPPALKIESLEVFRGAAAYPVRWSRANANVTVFFTEAVKDRYRLVITGETPTKFREPTLLPLAFLRDVEFQSNRMVVRQRPDVLIENLEVTGLVADSGDVTEGTLAIHQEGRIVKSYLLPSTTADQTKATISFLTRRNRPLITGRIDNYLSFRDNNLWLADTHLTLDVKPGVIDELRIAVPPAWSEPLTITPDLDHEIVGSGMERVLVIRPGSSIRGRFRLQIQCESQRATVALSEVPLPRILNESQVQQFLVLPGRLGEEMISWETSGLQEIQNLPNQDSPLPDDDATSYRVEGTRVTAVVHNVGKLGGTPQVQLADIHVALNRDRTCYGVAAFDVIPLQMTECLLVVPTGLSIKHVNVAGVPVSLRSASDSDGDSDSDVRLWIPLGPAQLPQRIDVVFFGHVVSTGAIPGEIISAPSLADLPVEQTLWTIHGAVGTAFDEALLDHIRSSEVQQAGIRASSATRVLGMAETLTPPVAEVGFESWKRTWERRRDLATSIAEGTRDPRADDTIDMLDLAARQFQGAGHGREPPVRFATQGASASVNVQFTQSEKGDVGLRVGISLTLAWLGLVLGLVVRKFRLYEWIEQSWHALGVCSGIVWWLWFTPSFVGLAVMALFLGAALWPIRKTRQVPRAAE